MKNQGGEEKVRKGTKNRKKRERNGKKWMEKKNEGKNMKRRKVKKILNEL